MDRSQFYRKFSVGLVLDTDRKQFREFIERYSPYIANVYFSLPMGERFHARRRVAEQLADEKNVDLFWDLLEILQQHDIRLEVVFNTGGITPEDISAGRKLMETHNVKPDLVGIVDELYDDAIREFPEAGMVFSFNNRCNGTAGIMKIGHSYQEYVIGRQDIRNRELMKYIREKKGAKTVLLVNNGCSFVCGGCSILRNCHEAYYREARKKSAQSLYAMQSIFPFELHENLLDMELIDLIKISSRNSDIAYLERCIRSYLDGEEEFWIGQSRENYYLWGRLAWHSEFYHRFSLPEIIREKREWYENGVWRKSEPLTGNTSVDFDLSDSAYSFDTRLTPETVGQWKMWIDSMAAGFAWEMGTVFLGISQNADCVSMIDREILRSNAKLLRELGLKVWLVLPKIDEINDGMKHLISLADGVVADDFDFAYELKKLGIPLGLGSRLPALKKGIPKNDYAGGNSRDFGKRLVREEFLEEYHRLGAEFVIVDMPPGGLQVGIGETVNIKARIMYDGRTAVTPDIRKTLVENRLTPVCRPVF